jgi:hypothetical protein
VPTTLGLPRRELSSRDFAFVMESKICRMTFTSWDPRIATALKQWLLAAIILTFGQNEFCLTREWYATELTYGKGVNGRVPGM